jgi:MYXO-CTERM domain-containing protein
MTGLIRKLSMCAVLAVCGSQSAQAALVNADFTLLRPDTVAMTGPAAVGDIGDNWNSINLASGDLVIATFPTDFTSGPLLDAAGDPTALTLTIGATDIRYWGSTTREPLSLMQDTLAPAWPGGTVTINNVTDGTEYDLYLYGASLNGSGGRFTVGGLPKETSGITQAGGVLVEGQDYVVFNNVTAVGTEIMISYGFPEWQSEGPVFNGLQIIESNVVPEIPGDINGDGFVGIEDLNIVLGNWNAGTPPPAGTPSIPEPASLTLLGLGGVAMLRRR